MAKTEVNNKKISVNAALSSIAALVAIFTFLTGYSFVPDMFKNSIWVQPLPKKGDIIIQPHYEDASQIYTDNQLQKMNQEAKNEIRRLWDTIAGLKSTNIKNTPHSRPKDCIYEGIRFSGGLAGSDFITFHTRSGNQFEFTGEISNQSYEGKAQVKNNKIHIISGIAKGAVLTLLEGCENLVGMLPKTYYPYKATVDLIKNN
jgi:hypothetical protein